MTMGPTAFWIVVVGLAVGSFALRFSFIGVVGDRPMPAWLLRHLRYTAVAIIPALVTPLVAWPSATGGTPDLARMAAAAATIIVGLMSRSVLTGMLSGATVLIGLLVLQG